MSVSDASYLVGLLHILGRSLDEQFWPGQENVLFYLRGNKAVVIAKLSWG